MDIILISSHKEVRDTLVEEGMGFVLAYPHIDLKRSYIDRYRGRKSSEAFISLLEKNWDAWINELVVQGRCRHLVLEAGEYLSHKLGALDWLQV